MNKNRLEAFSDGVFAIVITLLVLDIRIPHGEYSQLPSELFSLLPNIVAYVISFALGGIYWFGHHYYFALVKKTDGLFTWINILLLLLVAFLPFPTALIGEYPFQTLPLLIYGATLLAVNAVNLALLLYLYYHKELTVGQFTSDRRKASMRLFVLINFAYILALAMSPFVPVASYCIYIAVIIFSIYTYATRNVGIVPRANDE